MNEIESEIEKLKMKRVELVNRMNITSEFDEKEELQIQVNQIQKQIDTLERFSKQT